MHQTHGVKIFKSSRVQIFTVFFIFRGFYFRILVVGRENRENLDLAKISRYTVICFPDQIVMISTKHVRDFNTSVCVWSRLLMVGIIVCVLRCGI